MSKIYKYNPFIDEQDIVLDTDVSDDYYFNLNQTIQQTIVGDFSSLATAYGVKLVPSAGALGTTYGFYSDIPGSSFEFERNYGGYFKASNAEYSYGVYATASGGALETWAAWFEGNVKANGILYAPTISGSVIQDGAEANAINVDDRNLTNATSAVVFSWYDKSHFMPETDIASGDFEVFKIGIDNTTAFYGYPLRLIWSYDNQWLQLDYGDATDILFLRANINSDYISSSTSNLGTMSGTTLAVQPNSAINTVPITVTGASASSNIGVTFGYFAPQTVTISVASPAVFTTAVAHGYELNQCIKLTTTGTLPTGLNTSTVYYVKNILSTSFEVSTTAGGASVATTVAGSGTHTATPLLRVTSASPHGRSARDPIFFAGGSPMPTGLTAGENYYVSDKGLTSTVFYVLNATNVGVTYHIVVTSAGGGSPYVYGQNADHYQIRDSATSLLNRIDKYGSVEGNLTTTPWRVGIIPNDSNYSGMWFSSAASAPTSSNYSFLGDPSNTFINGPTYLWFRVGNTTQFYLSSSLLNFADGVNFLFGSTTGSVIASSSSQKMAFWGSTPIVRPTTSVAGATRTGGGGTTLTDTDTFDGYTVGQVVKALRNTGLLA